MSLLPPFFLDPLSPTFLWFDKLFNVLYLEAVGGSFGATVAPSVSYHPCNNRRHPSNLTLTRSSYLRRQLCSILSFVFFLLIS
ncbi:putative U1 small nuclear ribonucleoprotein like protein [Fusarium oxysporum f. sp. albedinis]|nr:putative U1 small nuclear ribonucleoprotein like protein [Fusarium oxysporum f. sp. albedinis]